MRWKNLMIVALCAVCLGILLGVVHDAVRQVQAMHRTQERVALDSVQHAAEAEHTGLPRPSPDLSPADVVRIQLEALARNDVPFENAGVVTAYNFASPSSRQVTGPLNKFSEMIRNPIYGALIGHAHARFGAVEVTEQTARVPVILVGRDASRVGYIFLLSLQAGGPFDACWMVDSVIRFEVQDRPEPEPNLVKA